MESKQLDGVEALAVDQKILAIARDNTNEWDAGGPGYYNIAIRNDAGRVYRTISVQSLGDYVGICESLPLLGLQNELKATQIVDGFDAIFSMSPQT